MKVKVSVLMGGKGSEREVSLVSGKSVVENLDKLKFDVLSIVISSDGTDWDVKTSVWINNYNSGFDKDIKYSYSKSAISKLKLPPELFKSDIVFIALHGNYGEDGTVQGLLDYLDIPYTGSGVLASALAMDKIAFKEIITAHKILNPKFYEVAKINKIGQNDNISFPLVVKPVDSGSSVGVSIVNNSKDLASAIKLAKQISKRVLIEEFIKGVEVTCGVWGNDNPLALPIIEICPKNKFFDYEAKYKGISEEIVPARLSKSLTEKVQKIAVEIFKIVGCSGFARVDMIIKKEKIYVLEINTIPGLTPQSLFPKEAKSAGFNYSKMLEKIIMLGIDRYKSA